MSRVHFAPSALLDLDEIWLWIAADSPTNADVFVARIMQKCDGLVRFPRSGRARLEFGPMVRSFPIGDYVVFYRVKDGEVEIARVLHGARDLAADMFENKPETDR